MCILCYSTSYLVEINYHFYFSRKYLFSLKTYIFVFFFLSVTQIGKGPKMAVRNIAQYWPRSSALGYFPSFYLNISSIVSIHDDILYFYTKHSKYWSKKCFVRPRPWPYETVVTCYRCPRLGIGFLFEVSFITQSETTLGTNVYQK